MTCVVASSFFLSISVQSLVVCFYCASCLRRCLSNEKNDDGRMKKERERNRESENREKFSRASTLNSRRCREKKKKR